MQYYVKSLGRGRGFPPRLLLMIYTIGMAIREITKPTAPHISKNEAIPSWFGWSKNIIIGLAIPLAMNRKMKK